MALSLLISMSLTSVAPGRCTCPSWRTLSWTARTGWILQAVQGKQDRLVVCRQLAEPWADMWQAKLGAGG
jgi:hypothetical protein